MPTKLVPTPFTEIEHGDATRRLIAGDPPLVIVDGTKENCRVFAYSAEWKGAHEIEVVGELVGEATPHDDEKITVLIRRAIEHRQATFRVCEICGESNPPEWMDDETGCQGCAEKELGIVY